VCSSGRGRRHVRPGVAHEFPTALGNDGTAGVKMALGFLSSKMPEISDLGFQHISDGFGPHVSIHS